MADEIEEFCFVTGVSRDRAEFFLEAAGGNLQVALDSFFMQTSSSDDTPSAPNVPPNVPPTEEVKSKPVAAKPKSNRGGVATLSDYRANERGGDNGDKGQEFFAGGSEHSGQMISGPPRKKKDLTKDLFEKVKEHGAVPLEDYEREQQNQSVSFIGTGFRLGDNDSPSDVIPGLKLSRQPEKVCRTLKLWKGGFSIDDGPLRNGESEKDKRFLHSVSIGEIPQELLLDVRGGEVDINIDDRRNENYVISKPKLVPFSGSGQKLGNITPEISNQSSKPTQATPAAPPTFVGINIDPSQPITSVQIRLGDGTRLVGKFNHSHTIGDIRQYIIENHPEMAGREFTLQTTFPNKTLTDSTQTISEAKLLNAVVVQRFL